METNKRQVMVSIDTGVEMGFAVWDYENRKELVEPIQAIVIKDRHKYENWIDRMNSACLELRRELLRYRVMECYVEWPGFFDNSGGHVVAKTGDLTKLGAATGWILAICCQACTHSANVRQVPVRDWKGQLPKRVVEKRIKALYPLHVHQKFKSHAWDAVGIGLWAKGFFK